ncbi:uncharacterized protein PV07_04472 [Cladophialophora immunda]|uniref:Uncharacterized protein n=1 Tax=Cladophialophora immunda TaxID=569365 RepID=A0A0D2CSR0_9EURO|nr:uncharacterized protein PV07_04472 [Cladophialophora immunda]KIW32965.1 hypothetical protein PV07_04472 [Cladophialophora immunda]OQV09171.1 hypothetical protein CLAIMM_13330 [Cladophialophora immunda]
MVRATATTTVTIITTTSNSMMKSWRPAAPHLQRKQQGGHRLEVLPHSNNGENFLSGAHFPDSALPIHTPAAQGPQYLVSITELPTAAAAAATVSTTTARLSTSLLHSYMGDGSECQAC